MLKTERDNIFNELQIIKSKDTVSSDPNEVVSLRKRILKLEGDLKDKAALANNLSAELDQLKTIMEELKRRASVGVIDKDFR